MAERPTRLRRALFLSGTAFIVLLLTGLGVGSYLNSAALVEENDWIDRTKSLITNLYTTMAVVRDAESGERGFLLTEDLRYLEPYTVALERWPKVREELRHQTNNTEQQADFESLVAVVEKKLDELVKTVTMVRYGRSEEALEVLRSNEGMTYMMEVRNLVRTLETRESSNMDKRLKDAGSRARGTSQLILVLGLFFFAVMVAGLLLFRREEKKGVRSEGQLRGILEGSSDAIGAVDTNLRVLLFNPAFVRFHQIHNHVTPQIGDSFPSLLKTLEADRAATLLGHYERALRGEEFTIIHHRHHEGRLLSFELRFSPIRSRSGRLIGSAQIMHDITEVQEGRDRFEEYARKLEASNRELTDFAFIASHDLQEPLRKIQAFGDRLKVKQFERLTDEGRDYLDRMQNAATRMQRLINDLLDYSRVTTKGKPPEPVDFRVIFAEVLSDLQVRIQETGAKVVVPAFPPAFGDPTQLRQLFQNLIGNALKYHRTGVPPEVTIALVPGDPLPSVTVSDNGIGFDPKHAEKIFEVFQRLHGREEFEGTGIGLAICRKIVERHGGTLKADGRPGEGATFTITFPGTFWAPKRGVE